MIQVVAAAAVTQILVTAGSPPWGPPGQAGGKFKPGWNGLARTPPMGWRSWNAYGNRITQDLMITSAEALAVRNRTVMGRKTPVSLCDIGYCSVGVDEGWEGCGMGVNGTQHKIDGTPTVDAAFPDIKQMVSRIHDLGLSAGWYLNGCKCGEHVEKRINYEGDIRDLHDYNFDGVKIDGCGRQRNQTLYAALMEASGKNYTIENCHWGDCTDSDDSSCPTHEWCPFNWYRSSGDINAGVGSWLQNLQTTIRFQDYENPLSVPGCWAYPDMLEVGRVNAPSPSSFYSWNRAHFGAWCIVSSPLILGMALTDDQLDPILDVISNPEAIAINQQYAGHPGMLAKTIVAPPQSYSPSGVIVPSTSAGDIDTEPPAEITRAPEDASTSGNANIRTGGPGDVSVIRVGTGLVGAGHKLDSVKMQFRYLAGYTGAGKAATVRVVLLDMASGNLLKTLLETPPLGNFSWDHFTGYSPPIQVHATNLNVPTDKPVIIALEVTNNQRNLQIPIDDKASGFAVEVRWAGSPTTDVPPATRLGAGKIGAQAGLFGSGQLWTKPQPNGKAATLLINHSPETLRYTLETATLNLTAAKYYVRDIWTRTDNGTTVAGKINLRVLPFDSAFLLLTPM